MFMGSSFSFEYLTEVRAECWNLCFLSHISQPFFYTHYLIKINECQQKRSINKEKKRDSESHYYYKRR